MPDKHKFDSLSISASAGCGKTQEMAMRLLGMFLARNDDIQKIFNSTMAVTFSRSGAKEIFNRVLELIFDALLHYKIDELNKNLQNLNFNLPVFDEKTFINLLRKLILGMNDLKICTIDSFMNKAVQSFSLELGLPGHVEIISSGEEQIMREAVIKKLLLDNTWQSNDMEEDMRDYTNESKKTSYGKNSRKYFNKIQETITKYERLADDNPGAEAYDFVIDTVKYSVQNRQDAWQVLKDNKSEKRLAATKQQASLYHVLEKLVTAASDTHFTTHELNRMRSFYSAWQYLEDGKTSKIPSFSKETFEKDEIESIRFLLEYGAAILLKQNIIRTQATVALSKKYRNLYDGIFYKQGKITFADLPRLLSNSTNDWIMDINYRLNNRFCHYLIDEFQDTNQMQWAVLSAIFEVPAPEDDRSIVIVGDVKQAIYGWRSGDRRLMNEVTQYMKNMIQLKTKNLDFSFRYGKNICTALNYLFDGNNIQNGGFFPGVGKAWADVFKTHLPAPQLKYRSIFEAYMPDANQNDTVTSFAALILKKIEEYNIIGQRNSCAILVRQNQDGLELLEELQKDEKYGKFFMLEGSSRISNDKLITALLHLLIYIQHPADTMAKEIAGMLRAVRPLIPATPASLNAENCRLRNGGFYKYLKNCIIKLQKDPMMIPRNFKDTESIELFLKAAQDFDNSSITHDSRLFKRCVNDVSHSEEAVGYKIRIMTMHHSKGLTFDHVFSAFFKGSNIVSREKNIAVAGQYGNGQKWILNSVNEESALFPQINAAWNAVTLENIFEDLCVTYVALSRAKYTMTLLLPQLSKEKFKKFNKNQSLSEEKSYFLSDYLATLLFHGDWQVKDVTFDSINHFYSTVIDDKDNSMPIAKSRNITVSNLMPLNFQTMPSTELRRRRIRPSDGIDDAEEQNPDKLYFALPSAQKGKFFGEDMHKILCGIENFKTPSLPDHISSAMNDELNRIFSNEKLCDFLSDYDECWCERTFDVILQNYYISGCFDRVQIKRNPDGTAANAVIVDYKSGFHPEQTNEKTLRYQRQLNTYRSALSTLLKLPVTNIKCYLLWTHDSFLEEVTP